MRSSSDGVTLRLKVAPRAARDRIEAVADGTLKVSVTAAPDRGRANEAVIALIARALQVPKSSITLVAGAAARHKTLRIAGDGPAIESRLRELRHG
jgi:uncharacterized protein (TIGR00251 family)